MKTWRQTKKDDDQKGRKNSRKKKKKKKKKKAPYPSASSFVRSFRSVLFLLQGSRDAFICSVFGFTDFVARSELVCVEPELRALRA